MYVHDIFMELTLNINHTQAVSTQFLGHARSAEKKKEKKKRKKEKDILVTFLTNFLAQARTLMK